MKGISRFTISPTRITARYPNGYLTYGKIKHVVIPEELLGQYLVPDVDSYHSDYDPLVRQLEDWVAAGYKQE